jgi:hypothetical protein
MVMCNCLNNRPSTGKTDLKCTSEMEAVNEIHLTLSDPAGFEL